MVRISKQTERRHQSPRRRRSPSEKTGPKKDNLEAGYKVHENSLKGDISNQVFIPKVR